MAAKRKSGERCEICYSRDFKASATAQRERGGVQLGLDMRYLQVLSVASQDHCQHNDHHVKGALNCPFVALSQQVTLIALAGHPADQFFVSPYNFFPF